jgi:hypothetical protein
MVVGFTTTSAISIYHHLSCEFESHSWWSVLPSGATCLTVNGCYSELTLSKPNWACWSSAKRTSSSSHQNTTCSRHGIAEKLLISCWATITHSLQYVMNACSRRFTWWTCAPKDSRDERLLPDSPDECLLPKTRLMNACSQRLAWWMLVPKDLPEN